MAKEDRCRVCDYSEGYGSDYADIPAGQNGRVRWTLLGPLCGVCAGEIDQAIQELNPDDPDTSDDPVG